MSFNPGDFLNSTVTALPPSGIRRFFDIAAEMDDVISLGVGEPDFVTPWHIRNEGVYSLEKGHTYYTPNRGLAALRHEISAYLQRRFNLKYDALTQTIVTVGGSEAIDIFMRSVLSPGDEVLVPEPSFVCYKPLATMAGGVAVPITTKAENKFKLTADELKAAITPKTKVIMLAHTLGNVFDLDEIKKLCEKYNLWLIEDNCDALGGTYEINDEKRLTGTIGDIGTSSFYPAHQMTMGEGGAVYTSNPLLHKIIRSLRDWGRECSCSGG